MTKQEAMELETKCDNLLIQCTGEDCKVSMALTGRLKVYFDANFIVLNKDYKTVNYLKYTGYYEDLNEYIEKIVKCVNENKELFDQLMWSYEHNRELE